MSAVHLEPLLVGTPFEDCFIVAYDALYHGNNNDPTLLLQKLEEASNQTDPIIIDKTSEHLHDEHSYWGGGRDSDLSRDASHISGLNKLLEEYKIKNRCVVFDNTWNDTHWNTWGIKHIAGPFYIWNYIIERRLKIPAWNHNPSKHFLCMNNIHKSHRQQVIERLHHDNCISKTLWSYRNTCDSQVFTSPTYIDQATGKFDQTANLNDLYNDCFYTIVTETDYTDKNIEHITEKTLMAILHGTVPIIVGVPGAIKLCKDLGFDMYDGIIDNSYDAVIDNNERFEKIMYMVENKSAEKHLDKLRTLLPTRVLRNQLLLTNRQYWFDRIINILFDKSKLLN